MAVTTDGSSSKSAGKRRRTRTVIDSNQLQEESLKSYLSASIDNYAVLTDYLAMEAYKGDTLSWIYGTMEILAQHPKQALILRSTRDICRLPGRAAISQEPLIDEIQTNGFSEYCRALLAAKRGDVSLQRQLLDHGREATGHIARMLQDMPTLASGIELVENTYSQSELKTLRRREEHTPQMREKFVRNVMLLADELFKSHGGPIKPPRVPEVRNTFVFRYALCGYISILMRIADGSARQAKPDRLRNDVIDVNLAAFATYFDGLLTADKRANEIYRLASVSLREDFGMPTWWLRPLLWIARRSSNIRSGLVNT